MTTPSLHQTFDTSLVDLRQSFSSTDPETSQSSSEQEDGRLPDPKSRLFRTLTTSELYSEWADTYDSDGNFLQAVDDIQIQEIIPALVLELSTRVEQFGEPLKILDLGCGTGRNTVKLLQHAWSRPTTVEAWDVSSAMLSVAETKCEGFILSSTNIPEVKFRKVDLTDPATIPSDMTNAFDLIVSTLVLEHIPLQTYWASVSDLLRRGGIGVVSNMHPRMSGNSIAGFADTQGHRVVGQSFVHGVEETVDAAKQAGLDILGDVREVAVTEEMLIGGQVSQRGAKWLGMKVWYGFCYQKR